MRDRQWWIGGVAFAWMEANPAHLANNTERLLLTRYGLMHAAALQFDRYGKTLQALFGDTQNRLVLNPVVSDTTVTKTATSVTLSNTVVSGSVRRYSVSITGSSLPSETRVNRSGELFQSIALPAAIPHELGVMRY